MRKIDTLRNQGHRGNKNMEGGLLIDVDALGLVNRRL